MIRQPPRPQGVQTLLRVGTWPSLANQQFVKLATVNGSVWSRVMWPSSPSCSVLPREEGPQEESICAHPQALQEPVFPMVISTCPWAFAMALSFRALPASGFGLEARS